MIKAFLKSNYGRITLGILIAAIIIGYFVNK